ncbi:MAG: hypothetical protein AAGL98_06920, partial [Planctomycetota bacterium]
DTGRRLSGDDDTWAGIETWGPLLRLSIELNEPRVRRHAERQVIRLSAGFPSYPGQDRLYLVGEALLALQYAVDATDERKPAP